VWEGHGDGTASGIVDGLPFRWTPWPLEGANLLLLRRCGLCGSQWPAPVRSLGQLIGALVESRCGCAHRPHPQAA
jgi:hypothetical protein